MDTRHMRNFLALSETLHFGNAAERMHMTQPAFSRQIAGIEKHLGVRLVERNSRNVSLTVAGRRFADDCQMVLDRFDAACRDARLVGEGMSGELRLGFMMHAAHGVVPRLVRLYAEARPNVRLTLEETIPAVIDEMLLEGRLDAAVTFAGTSPYLASVPVGRDRLRLIVPAGHPLAGRDAIGPRDLAAERLIAAPATVAPTLRLAIGAYFATADVVPRYAFEPRLQQTIVRLVAEGLGVALVPESLTVALGPDVVSVTATGAPVFDVVLAASARSRNPAVAPLLELARRMDA